jgi:hypothetical protein
VEIYQLRQRKDLGDDTKVKRGYFQFEKLLGQLSNKDLPGQIATSINSDIDELNAINSSGKELRKQLLKRQKKIVRLLERELKLVPVNHYRNTWMAIGMAAFGVPLGTTFGLMLDNMAFIGIGLPIGLAIGLAIGTGMDKKAYEEGRQLDIEVEY